MFEEQAETELSTAELFSLFSASHWNTRLAETRQSRAAVTSDSRVSQTLSSSLAAPLLSLLVLLLLSLSDLQC